MGTLVIAACAPQETRDDAPGEIRERRGPSAFDTEIENPDTDVLDRTVKAAVSFDVRGARATLVGSGVAIAFQDRYFLLTAHHTFRRAGLANVVATELGIEGVPSISCFRQHKQKLCPQGPTFMVALPDTDTAILGPMGSPPAGDFISLEDDVLTRSAIADGQLLFSWGYPYGYGPAFKRSRFAYVKRGPLTQGGENLGDGREIDTLYLRGWVSPGDSGAPLFTFDGRLAGIINGGGTDPKTGEGYATAIPVWSFVPELRQLLLRALNTPPSGQAPEGP